MFGSIVSNDYSNRILESTESIDREWDFTLKTIVISIQIQLESVRRFRRFRLFLYYSIRWTKCQTFLWIHFYVTLATREQQWHPTKNKCCDRCDISSLECSLSNTVLMSQIIFSALVIDLIITFRMNLFFILKISDNTSEESSVRVLTKLRLRSIKSGKIGVFYEFSNWLVIKDVFWVMGLIKGLVETSWKLFRIQFTLELGCNDQGIMLMSLIHSLGYKKWDWNDNVIYII